MDISEPSTCVYLFHVDVPQADCARLTSGVVAAASGAREASGGAEGRPKRRFGAEEATPPAKQQAALTPQRMPEPAQGAPADLSALSTDGALQAGEKRAAVVAALAHAWMGYERYAWGQDELKPISKSSTNWIGQGLTILDSLDVLWLAGLRREFDHGMEWVTNSLNCAPPAGELDPPLFGLRTAPPRTHASRRLPRCHQHRREPAPTSVSHATHDRAPSPQSISQRWSPFLRRRSVASAGCSLRMNFPARRCCCRRRLTWANG